MIAERFFQVLSFFLVCTALQAQQLPVVRGTIQSDEGEMVPFATVHILPPYEQHTVADGHGMFYLKNLPSDVALTVEVHAIGYKPLRREVRLSGAELKLILITDVRVLDELSIISSGIETKQTTVNRSVVELERTDLERRQGAAFVNLLESVPGVSTLNTGVGIAKPVIRGMAFNRVMVNDQGVKQEGQQWGSDHGLEIDQFDVHRVEIVKGAASLIYGPDAMGGVINLKAPQALAEGSWQADAQTLYKSNNNLRAFSLGAATRQKDLTLRGRYSYQDFDNYRVPATSFNYAGFVIPIAQNTLRNTAGKERNFSFSARLDKDWGHSTFKISRFRQQVGLFPGAVGIPTAYQLQQYPEQGSIGLPHQETTHWKLVWNTRWLLGNNTLSLDLGYQHNQRQERSRPHLHNVARSAGTLAHGFDLRTYTANLSYQWVHQERWTSILGSQTQLMHNRFSGFEFLIPRFESFQTGLFWFTEFVPKPTLKLNAGLRGDYGQHDITEHLQPLYENLQPTGEFSQRNPDIFREFANLSASMGLAWQPTAQLELKANLGSSYRMPTAIELSSNGIHHGTFRHEKGNPDLLPERGIQLDLELGYQNQWLRTVFTPFVSYYDQYIYLAPTAFFSTLPSGSQLTWEFRQADSYFWGAELSTRFQPLSRSSIELGLEYVSANNLQSSLPLPLTPPFSAIVELSQGIGFPDFPLERIELMGSYRYAAAQNRVDRNERETPGYQLVEVGAKTYLRMASVQAILSVHIENLFNTSYLNHLSRYRRLNLPEQGRNIIVSLKVPVGNIGNK